VDALAERKSASVVCIVLVAGLDSPLEREVLERPDLAHLHGLHRALLPVEGTTILDHWNTAIIAQREIQSTYVVSSGAKFKQFERWATSNGIPVDHVVNNGVCDPSMQRGAVLDMLLGMKRALRHSPSSSTFLIIGGDNLFNAGFDLGSPLKMFRTVPALALVLGYAPRTSEDLTRRGLARFDRETCRVASFVEKADAAVAEREAAAGALCVPTLYVLHASFVHHVQSFVEQRDAANAARAEGDPTRSYSLGSLLQAVHRGETRGAVAEGSTRDASPLVASTPSRTRLPKRSALRDIYGMRLPFFHRLLKNDLPSFERFVAQRAERAAQYESGGGGGDAAAGLRVSKRSFARAGLVGNPSDGFFGKTISVTMSNFWADVTLSPSKRLVLVPHKLYDPHIFGGLKDLHGIGTREGYQGGVVLLMATCKRFFEFCMQRGIALAQRNFRMEYDTNIPRQVGMSGSSAIVTAAFRALMEYYSLAEDDIPAEVQPSFVLSVETMELNINAGLQDRVVQCYEGLIAMDFERTHMEAKGHGKYTRLDVALLPPLFVAYLADPSDSGKIHADVKARWARGDEEVRAAMRSFADFTDAFRDALARGDAAAASEAMRANFALRRQLYGDACVGAANLQMVAIAESFGCAAKFAGSGGTIVGICKQEQYSEMQRAFEAEDFVFSPLSVRDGTMVPRA
jgi:glucuronokinase